MRWVLTFTGAFSAAIGLGSAVTNAEVLKTFPNKVILREFSIDATNTSMKFNARCSNKEIESGLWNLISFNKNYDNRIRDFVPSYHPLNNVAAWYIDSNECPSLKPYLNGLGFDSYDPKSGDAVIYLAAFNQKPVDQAEWNKTSDDGLSRMRLIFRPEFDVINVLRFRAKCNFTYPSLSSKLGFSDPEFVCTLLESKGFVRFALPKP